MNPSQLKMLNFLCIQLRSFSDYISKYLRVRPKHINLHLYLFVLLIKFYIIPLKAKCEHFHLIIIYDYVVNI